MANSGAVSYIAPVKLAAAKIDTAWRKSRIAARLLIRRESRPLRPWERALAQRLARDPEVSSRLIEQAFYFLSSGPRSILTWAKTAFNVPRGHQTSPKKLLGGGLVGGNGSERKVRLNQK